MCSSLRITVLIDLTPKPMYKLQNADGIPFPRKPSPRCRGAGLLLFISIMVF